MAGRHGRGKRLVLPVDALADAGVGQCRDIQVAQASRLVAGLDGFQRRLDVVAGGNHQWAARAERAPRGEVEQRRGRPGHRDELLVPAGVQGRQRSEQAHRVGHAGPVEHVVDRPRLHRLPGVHHHDPVGHPRHDPQVVGDEDHGGARGLLGLLDGLEDLRLHRDVEGGGRLVGDDDVGVVGDRHGDHRPLAHPTGELVGIVAGTLRCTGNADERQQVGRPALRLLLRDVVVGEDGLGELGPHAVHRVERGHRVLEHHGDLQTP